MGKRGPAPKPTALRIVHGDKNQHPERVNDAEPLPSAGEVVPPGWLSPEAVEVWGERVPDLVDKRVMTPWDIEAFAVYCDAVVLHRDAAGHLHEEGAVIEAPVFDKNGKPTGHRMQKSQWAYVWKDTAEIIQRYGARFGLTPSDRSQISVGEGEAGKGARRLLS
jgi:P27 family predicted phage terminase small subunit